MFQVIPGSSNGRTRAFGARYPGSNPGPGANLYVLDKISTVTSRMELVSGRLSGIMSGALPGASRKIPSRRENV